MRESLNNKMRRGRTNVDDLQTIIDSFAKVTITVLGDMVADEFVFGEISRVSREAPVLILKRCDRTVLPGGGANAVNNLADLGVKVFPVGLIGDDEPGRLLRNSFRKKGISLGGLLTDGIYDTVTKTRILAGMTHGARQQVVRVDREPSAEPSAKLHRRLIQTARKYAPRSSALLVSDYNYGAATPELLAAVRQGRLLQRTPIVLDSRYRLLQYSGVTAATPNEPEVEQALGMKIGEDWPLLCDAGRQVVSDMKLKSLIITRGRHGMVAFTKGRPAVDIPIFGSDQVADVTGAGDTVIATFTAALAAGASTEQAAHLANYAGGIVVMKRGTATVSREELSRAIHQSPPVTNAH